MIKQERGKRPSLGIWKWVLNAKNSLFRSPRKILDRVKDSWYNLDQFVQYGEQMAMGRYSVPSLTKAFRMLEIISESRMDISISELSRRLGLSKGTIFAIATTLEGLGVLVRDPVTKRFSLGYTLLELGRRALVRQDVREVARKPMEELAERVQETVFLGALNGDHVTVVDVAESKRELKITAPSGTRLPLLVGATGKVFLASMDRERAREVVNSLGLAAYTPKSITDVHRYMEEIEEVREKGFATDDEEYMRGVRAVACPLGAPPLFHAIWVVGFSASLDDKTMVRVIDEVRKTSHDISEALRT